jgi:hypothetical protein
MRQWRKQTANYEHKRKEEDDKTEAAGKKKDES